MNIPQIGEPLSKEHLTFLSAFAKSCRWSTIAMVKNAQSGHPGGSLSSMEWLTLIYTFIVSQTGDDVVISNGHISPAVYSILAELGYISKQDVIEKFRKPGDVFEGHVTREVAGVHYGTGPLGIGASAACGLALAEKLKEKKKRSSEYKVDERHVSEALNLVNEIPNSVSETPIPVSEAPNNVTAKKNATARKVFLEIGDGEAQEGQIYEMIHFARKYELDNLITFVDFNEVQLSDGLEKIMPIDIVKTFEAAHWEVFEVDGHDFEALWKCLEKAYRVEGKPSVIVGHTIMGKGVSFMEAEGRALKATWHGSPPKPEQADIALKELELTREEKNRIEQFLPLIKWHPKKPDPKKEPFDNEKIASVDYNRKTANVEVRENDTERKFANNKQELEFDDFQKSTYHDDLKSHKIDIGEPIVYSADTLTDCRTAYGKALLDLAKRNPQILAITADLKASVMTKFVDEELPDQHIECGIAEQHMVSMAGGLSLSGFIPFTSTFGAFMTSRAKDQARVNDINRTNVKMVATHCGLSVGEDGPTHQAIDDMGSMLGFFHTMVIEPADPNQTDRIIRYIASHWGNFYVRMGRHKFPIITKEDGAIFYDEKYVYQYGKTDTIRKGKDLTIVASGAMVHEAMKAREMYILKYAEEYTGKYTKVYSEEYTGKYTKERLEEYANREEGLENLNNSIEIIAASSIKKFDDNLLNSIRKTKKVITVEDHNTYSGLGSQLARILAEEGICVETFRMLGVRQYQLSGKAEELYEKAGISAEHIKRAIQEILFSA